MPLPTVSLPLPPPLSSPRATHRTSSIPSTGFSGKKRVERVGWQVVNASNLNVRRARATSMFRRFASASECGKSRLHQFGRSPRLHPPRPPGSPGSRQGPRSNPISYGRRTVVVYKRNTANVEFLLHSLTSNCIGEACELQAVFQSHGKFVMFFQPRRPRSRHRCQRLHMPEKMSDSRPDSNAEVRVHHHPSTAHGSSVERPLYTCSTPESNAFRRKRRGVSGQEHHATHG